MNQLFQVTVYTGQHLVLECLKSWLQRPCVDETSQRQRRSIKSLIVLLLKTAATGVLATILDAAIEYRRRQLLLVAQEEEPGSTATSDRLSSFGGVLSRAGISAWKTRLLGAIDEMERQAEQYGIEPTHRFTPSKSLEADDNTSSTEQNSAAAHLKGKESVSSLEATEAALSLQDGKLPQEDGGDRQVFLSQTVEQLRELVAQGGEEAERSLDQRVDLLLDTLLGGASCESPDTILQPLSRSVSSSTGFGASGSYSNVAALDRAMPTISTGPGSCGFNIADTDEEREVEKFGGSMCHICMDRQVRVSVIGCNHDLCFQCARTLCASQDHAVPQCPFCRQAINGFEAVTVLKTATAAC